MSSIGVGRADDVAPALSVGEEVPDTGMRHGFTTLVHQQVLLGYIGDVAHLIILSQQVVKGLVLTRSDILRDRPPPLLSVSKFHVNVENHPAKRKDAVADDVAYLELGNPDGHNRILTPAIGDKYANYIGTGRCQITGRQRASSVHKDISMPMENRTIFGH